MKDLASTIAIRNRMKHAWAPFFSRFGRLTPIQELTIPKVLDGANVVVASPTASGKTEAVVAPIAERFVRERWESLAVLYVVPTRALANDSLTRIAGPLGDMGVKAVLRHGDKPYLPLDNLPNLLITTPESLDSLTCRHTEVFAGVRTIILDEIHLLDGTYRGDQLRLLLRRLRENTSDPDFNVHLLSATLSEPQETAQRYVDDAEIIAVAGQREIDSFTFASHEEALRLAREMKWMKVLYFCNLRESVENLARDLEKIWHPYPVVAHHGNLSRHEREDAEQLMKEGRVAVCVATSTLEIGIDIGDIDLVVLAEVPWSISSLLQRVGRGNRREGRIRVAAVLQSEEEREVLSSMLAAAATGDLPPAHYHPDHSVAIQQIFSCLFQYPGGLAETRLASLLSPLCSEQETKLILNHLQDKGWLEKRADCWFASTRLMDQGEFGNIHSNIQDSQTYTVVDIDSGREVGKISGAFDETFVLAHRTWKVVSMSGARIKVRRVASGKGFAPVFQRTRNVGKFFYLLPQEMKTLRQSIDHLQQ